MSTVRTKAGRTFVEAADHLGYGAYDAARFAGLGEEFEDAVAAIEAEMRAATLGEVDDAIVDAPCHHAADFGAGPEVDPGPCLIDRDDLLDAIHAADKEPS